MRRCARSTRWWRRSGPTRLTSTPCDSRPNTTSTWSNRPSSPLYDSSVRAPEAGSDADGVDGDDPDARAPLGEPPGQVQLGDVAAEEVLEIDRRDEEVDRDGASSRTASSSGAILAATVPTATLFGLSGRAPGRSVVGGRASIRRRLRGRSSPRVAATTRRRQTKAKKSAISAPSVSDSPTSSRAARRARLASAAGERSARGKLSSARRLRVAHPSSAAHLEDGRELDRAGNSPRSSGDASAGRARAGPRAACRAGRATAGMRLAAACPSTAPPCWT